MLRTTNIENYTLLQMGETRYWGYAGNWWVVVVAAAGAPQFLPVDSTTSANLDSNWRQAEAQTAWVLAEEARRQKESRVILPGS